MVTVAGLSTGHGSSSISDSSPGMGSPTITMDTAIITHIHMGMDTDMGTEMDMDMIPALTKGAITTIRAVTILPIKTQTQLLPALRTNWRGEVITADKSMASLVRQRGAQSRGIRETTGWA